MSRAASTVFHWYFSFFALAILCLFLYTCTSPAHAQTDTGTDPFTLDVSPQYPAPFETLTITPSSSSFDIAGATISVTVNGTSFYKGTGGASIQIPLSGPGSTTNVTVTAVSGGQTYTQRLSVHPADVALVVEPVSTTHPFYAGEGLVSSEGQLHLVAIPDLRTSTGKAISPSSLVYTWSLGDQVLDSDSGIGKSVLNATAPQRYRDANVSVTVASQDGSVIAKASTTISPVDPLTRIYRDDPLLGPLFDIALTDSFTMTDTEDTFFGVPYYFSSTPTLNWVVNGTDSGADPDITVRSTGNGSGTAVIGFTANDSGSTQTANSTVSVTFGQKSTLGFFGL